MELRVDGKVALITGADSGIGRGIALQMAAAVAWVWRSLTSENSAATKKPLSATRNSAATR